MARKPPKGEAYTHNEATRKNNPEPGMIDYVSPLPDELRGEGAWDVGRKTPYSTNPRAADSDNEQIAQLVGSFPRISQSATSSTRVVNQGPVQQTSVRQPLPDARQAIADLANPSLLSSATSAPDVLSPLRYPGGKRRLAPFVAAVLQDNDRRPDLTVEPFAGGASVALYLLQHNLTDRIGLADLDPYVAAFWETVFFDTAWLVEEIGRIPVTLEQWKEFKLGVLADRRSRAIACLFLNRTSFSGILAQTAGPIGGKAQKSKYKIGCRFPRKTLQTRIEQLGQLRERVAFVYEASWTETLTVTDSATLDGWDVFTYLDPPFFNKADRLYRFYFESDEHKELRDQTVRLKCDWLLSYDSVPRVAELYLNEQKLDLGALYTASTAGGYRQVNEAVVSNLQLPKSTEPNPDYDMPNSGKDTKRA